MEGQVERLLSRAGSVARGAGLVVLGLLIGIGITSFAQQSVLDKTTFDLGAGECRYTVAPNGNVAPA
jgi:hypothetical protein